MEPEQQSCLSSFLPLYRPRVFAILSGIAALFASAALLVAHDSLPDYGPDFTYSENGTVFMCNLFSDTCCPPPPGVCRIWTSSDYSFGGVLLLMGSVLSFFTGLVMLAGGKAEGPMLVTSPTNGCPDLWQLMYRSAAAVYIIAGVLMTTAGFAITLLARASAYSFAREVGVSILVQNTAWIFASHFGPFARLHAPAIKAIEADLKAALLSRVKRSRNYGSTRGTAAAEQRAVPASSVPLPL